MFSTELLDACNVRYLVVAEGILPIASLALAYFFVDLKEAGKKVSGRPPPFIFGIVWTFIAVSYFLSMLVSAMNFDTATLATFAAFGFLLFIGCVWWVMLYKKGHKHKAAWTLMLTSLMAILMTVTSLCVVTSLDSYAQLLVSVLSAPFGLWCIFATVLSLVELQASP
jgi:tryptophan-rich sensory protein